MFWDVWSNYQHIPALDEVAPAQRNGTQRWQTGAVSATANVLSAIHSARCRWADAETSAMIVLRLP